MNNNRNSTAISILKNKKIFLIDDDLTQLTLISGTLRKLGLDILTFQNPSDALKAVSTGNIPDIILTDIFMPRINGWELCRILKSDLFPQTKEIPILILSSQIVGDETKKIAKEAGAYDFIELPTSPEVIFEKLITALTQKEPANERIKILIIKSSNNYEIEWFYKTDDPRYFPYVVHSIDEAVHFIKEETVHILLLPSKIEGDLNKLFLILDTHPQKDQILTIMTVSPNYPKTFLNWVEKGISGILTEPVSLESLLILYDKLKTEKLLIKTKLAVEEKIKKNLEEELRWITILESIPVGIFIKDENLKYTQVNKSYASFFKKEPIDFITNPDTEFFDEPHANEFRIFCQEALNGKTIQSSQWEVNISNITYIFHLYIAPLKNPKGEISGIYGYLVDITSELALQENYKNLFESMAEAFAEHEIIYDEQGTPIDYRFLNVNPSFETMTGLKKEQVIGKTVKEVLPNLEEFWITKYANVVSTGKPITFENYTKTLDRYYLVHAYKSGKNRFACIFTDITPKKKFEEEIKRLNREWQLAFDNLNSVIWFLNHNHVITKTNNAVSKILHLAPDEVLGKKCWEAVHGTNTPPDFCPVIKLLKTKKRETLEFQKDEKWYEVIVDPVFDEEHNFIGVVHILSDITERKKAEKERQELQNQLLQSQKLESLGRLVSGIAHDFNNMLSVILGHIELAILKYESQEEIKEHLLEARKAVTKSAEIASKILTFAKKQDLKPKVLNLNTEISQSLKILRKIIPETISVEFQPGENLWDTYLDPAHLDAILLNLFVNAKDAIKEQGKISVKTENVVIDSTNSKINPEIQCGEYVKISVSDTGHGIPPEILPYIFDPFFTTKKESRGSGLGLSIVYGAVKQNNGFINVKSEPNKGTTFEIYLPRTTATNLSPKTESEKESLIEEFMEYIHQDLVRNKVLIVEDEETLADVIENIVEKLGLEPITADKPSSALKILEQEKDSIKLAIIDLVLPEMNGVQLAEKINNICPSIRTLLITGYMDAKIVHQTDFSEKIKVLRKPFSINELSETINQLLTK